VTPALRIDAEIGTANITWGALSTFFDISDRCFSFNIQRGRNDYTRPFSAGTGTFTFRNLDGYFDPDNPTGLAQGIKIGRRVLLTINPGTIHERLLYVGFITDISLSYDLSGEATCTFSTADALSILAQQQIADGTTFPQQTTRERFDAVLQLPELDYVFVSGGSAGLSTCAAGNAAGNALSYLNKVITTEQGAMFVDREGVLLFRNRSDVLNVPTETFDDTGIGLNYQGIERSVPSLELYNRLQANRSGEDAVVRESATSPNRFGIRFLDLGEVLFATDAEVTEMLDYAMVKFASSRPRIASITTMLDDKTAATIADIVTLELTDAVTVKFTPPGTIGITVQASIEAISHQCTVGGKWLVTFGLAPRGNYLILDDVELGKLDQNALAL